MVSLIVHALLGVARHLADRRRRTGRSSGGRRAGPLVVPLECVYYLAGVASVVVGWYFNVRFVMQYAHGHANPIWGDGSWAQYIRLMYANPAAARRRGLHDRQRDPPAAGHDRRRPPRGASPARGCTSSSSLFTSFAFAWAFYLATTERQRRHAQTPATVEA